MLGKRIINTATGAGAACTTDTVQILGDTSCVAYYKMSDATDETGSYDGTATNVNFNVAGKFGNAGYFNGGASYVNLNSAVLPASVFSISIWINLNSLSTGWLFSQYTGSVTGRFVFNVTATGGFQINVSSTNSLSTTNIPVITTNNWYHVVVVKDGSNGWTLYADGASHSTWNSTENIITNQNTILGGDDSVTSSNMIGKIDQVRIFNRAITATEVETLYNEVQCIPTIVPTDYFNTVLYTGDGTTSQGKTGVGFQPDFTWIKNRSSSGNNHALFDSVRGIQRELRSDSTAPEIDYTATNYSLKSFDIDGFTVGDITAGNYNVNGAVGGTWSGNAEFVAWNWKAGGADVLNEEGTIDSQVSANVDAGFSIVKYTGNGTNGATVGHGLSSAPELVLIKQLSTAGHHWKSIAAVLGAGKAIYLNLDIAAVSGQFNNTLPTDDVFTLDTDTNDNENNASHIAYAFHSVEGYSRIGSYDGTGASGNYIVTGFRPAFVMMKAYDDTSDWFIVDNKRNLTDPRNSNLRPNNSNTEANAASGLNFLSNGFEFTGAAFNDNNVSWIYMAFAEENVQPEPELANSFNVVTYTGTGTTGGNTLPVTGFGFQPDLVWVKNRDVAVNHYLYDSVRGTGTAKALHSNTTSSESSASTYSTNGGVSSFLSDGFTAYRGTDNTYQGTNMNGQDYVAWAWKASNDSTINQDGSITSIVSANPAAGFSVVSTQSDGSGYLNFGHGLSQAPELVITKFTGQTGEWYTYTSAISNGFDVALKLNSSDAAITAYGTNKWSATSTVVAIGNPQWYFTANVPFITYCFHSVDGYQKIGSYTGNGTTSNRIYTTNDGTSNGTDGFEPRFLLVKQTNASRNWNIYDNLRVQDRPLFPNLSSAEAGDAERLQFNSDGFTWTNSAADFNASGGTYIYLAIA